MREKLKALYELQQIDLEIAKAQKTKASLDDGSAKAQEADAARQAHAGAEKALHDAAAEQRDKELNVKTIEVKTKALKDKLFSGKVTNSKELSNIEKEIEMLARQKDKLEERILELYDVVEAAKADAESTAAVLAEKDSELSAHMTKLKKNIAVLNARVKDAASRREAGAAAVDPVLMKRYEAGRARFGGVVVSKVVDGDCSACHTSLGPGMVRELKADGALVTCDNCGRILYME